MIIFILVVLIILFILYCALYKFNCNGNYKNRNIIKGLARQASRYSIASLQDSDLFIALLHSNYSVAYGDAIRQYFSDKEIDREISKENFDILMNTLEKNQDIISKRIAEIYPNILPLYNNETIKIAEIAGEK